MPRASEERLEYTARVLANRFAELAVASDEKVLTPAMVRQALIAAHRSDKKIVCATTPVTLAKIADLASDYF